MERNLSSKEKSDNNDALTSKYIFEITNILLETRHNAMKFDSTSTWYSNITILLYCSTIHNIL